MAKRTETTETPANQPEATQPEAPKTDATVAPLALCACGCGIAVGKRSEWRQGHDQRAKGWLQRAIAGRLFEGERALVEALLSRESARRALSSATFAPLVAGATAALAPKAEQQAS